MRKLWSCERILSGAFCSVFCVTVSYLDIDPRSTRFAPYDDYNFMPYKVTKRPSHSALIMTPHEPFLLHQPRPMEQVVPMESMEASSLQLKGTEDSEDSLVSVELNPGTPWISVSTVLQCAVAFSLTAAIVFTNLLVLLVRIKDKRLRKQVSNSLSMNSFKPWTIRILSRGINSRLLQC